MSSGIIGPLSFHRQREISEPVYVVCVDNYVEGAVREKDGRWAYQLPHTTMWYGEYETRLQAGEELLRVARSAA